MAEPLVEEHPLSLELQSLRASVARFQDEAHASAVKLQRHSLDAVRAHERAVYLERENDVLKSELAVLRGNPSPTPLGGHPSSSAEGRSQIEELTLSLRRLSHKLSLTEEALLVANNSLASSQAQSLKASANADNAYELGARVRGREEEALAKQMDLEWRIKRLEEELRMSDGVVREYASLVRGLETRSSSDSEPLKLEDSLKEGKMGLERLFKELQGECDASERKLHAKHAELEVCRSQLDAERRTKESLEKELAGTRTELEKLKLEDGTAAKMVSKYMQFSQTATNNLLTTLNSLQARHNGTLSTLSSQNHLLSTKLRSLEHQNEQLRSTLDELGGEIMKETYGRRREIAQRIRMGGREERIVEGLRRWIRRGDEMLSRLHGDDGCAATQSNCMDALIDMSQHARILLEGLENGVLDEESAFSLSGARARETLVRMGIDGLLEELGKETERRISLEKAFAKGSYHDHDINKGMEIVKPDNDDPPPKVPDKVYRAPDKKIASPTSLIPSEGKNEPILPLTVVESLDTKTDDIEFPKIEDAVLLPKVENFEEKISTTPVDLQQLSSSVEETIAEQMGVVEEPRAFVSEALAGRDEGAQKTILSQSVPESDDVGLILTEVMTATIDDENSAHDNDEVPTPAIVTPPVLFTEDFDEPLTALPDLPVVLNVQDVSPLHVIARSPSIPDASPAVESISVQVEPHPMLAELVRINKRYDDLQRAFRDCHLALESLKAGLGTDISSSSSSQPFSPFNHSSTSSSTSSTSSLISPTPMSHVIPTNILRAALGRLDDFTEDARVELEIRVGDETLLAKGYEALLSVPGALNLNATSDRQLVLTSSVQRGDEDIDDIPVQSEVEKQIEAFVCGSDPAVRKARDTFTKKLEDVQHDIAALKRAIHDPESLETFQFSLDASASASATSPNLPSYPEHTNGHGNADGNGNGWTSWIKGSPSSRPSTPAPLSASLGPSPTFGSIMTSPRLRHSPSNGSFQQSQGSRSRKGSFFGFGLGGGAPAEQIKDPLSVLGLRVPMPQFGFGGGVGPSGGVGMGYGLMSPTSPMGSAPRPRTVSTTMYSLGIGAHSVNGPASSGSGKPVQISRSVSAGYGQGQAVSNSPSFPYRQQPAVQLASKNGKENIVDEEGGDSSDEDMEDEDNTDVE